jgi:SAM-dependent methyltransferase
VRTGLTGLTRLIRRGRALLERWSPQTDRVFHDELFKAQTFDPFDPSYPGRLTILRFADAASAYIPAGSFALDLGCGSGEITCELGRRHLDVRFLGVDHSQAGIDRARAHASRLGLGNVSFEAADIERFEPPEPPGIVLFFDSFHHSSDPAALVRRLGEVSSRFLCIEPQGDWKGSWRRELDFDWLVADLERVRVRLASMLGEVSAPPPQVSAPLSGHGEAIEHRYGLHEFQRFFPGFFLEVRGTVAGLETYPPNPYASSPTRVLFNGIACDLLKWLDDELHRRDLDLLAKHWVIYAQRGVPRPLRAVPPAAPRAPDTERVTGSYDVEYLSYDGPREAPRQSSFRATVRLRNRSWRRWSTSGECPIRASYHWLDSGERMHTLDGERTPLPRPIGAGEECSLLLSIRTPAISGRCFLAIDLVEEGTSWFSDAGVPWLKIPFRLRR